MAKQKIIQYAVTSWKQGGEHSDQTRNFSTEERAFQYARREKADGRKVEVKRRELTTSGWEWLDVPDEA